MSGARGVHLINYDGEKGSDEKEGSMSNWSSNSSSSFGAYIAVTLALCFL